MIKTITAPKAFIRVLKDGKKKRRYAYIEGGKAKQFFFYNKKTKLYRVDYEHFTSLKAVREYLKQPKEESRLVSWPLFSSGWLGNMQEGGDAILDEDTIEE